MIITGPTLREIKKSARLAGVSIHNLRREDSRRHRLVIRADGGCGRRKVGANVCWHGHRDFMREVFKHEPNARIKTSLAHYRSREDFEARYRGTKRGLPGAPCHLGCGDPE